MSEVLLEEVCPNGNIQAVVEIDDDVCTFYLFGAPETDFETKSVWVRNLGEAPEKLDADRMRAGQAPRNPVAHCLHQAGQASPRREDLRLVWLPEGNGAALYENEELLAIIPTWSGQGGFCGYARDCLGDGPVAWEIGSDNILPQRFEEAQAYWEAWSDEELWPSVQTSLLNQIESMLGKYSNYYAIDGGNWPPKAMVQIPHNDSKALITLGVSLRPQPNVETAADDYHTLRRIELGAMLPASWPAEAVNQFAAYLSGQSSLPWTKYTWLGSGHTIPCDSWQNRDYTFALLMSQQGDLPAMQLGPVMLDPVSVLWLLPITAEERNGAMEYGSNLLADRLPADRWRDA